MTRRLALLLLLLTACKKAPKSQPPPAPSPSATVNGFQVALSASPPGLVIKSADGRTLLESYAGQAPYLGFAARSSGAKYEEQFGAFKITDVPQQDWLAGDALTVTESSATRMAFTVNAGGKALLQGVIEGAGEGTLRVKLTGLPDNNRTSLAFKCADADHFLGFGAQTDALDHHGHTVPIWVAEQGIGKSGSDDPPDLWQLEGARHSSYFPLPYYVSSRGYGLLLQTPHRSIFELCSKQSDALRLEAWEPGAELLLFDGPGLADIVRRATAVLGRQQPATPLELAPWNDAIFGSANVRRVAQLLRDQHIPSSVIWTEDFRGGHFASNGTSYRLIEEWDTDRTLYPDAEQVAADLHKQGFAWFAYFNTFLVSGTRVYANAQDAGVFVKDRHGNNYLFSGPTFVDTGLLDLNTQAGRDFMRGYLNQALDIGFDGWMADFAEWYPADAEVDGGDAPAAHNLYPLAWQQLNREVLAARQDGRARTFFVRSGYLGTNPVVPAVWAGDQRTDFEADDGLPTVVPLGLGLGLSGISTYGSDIGGYQSATNAPSTKELFFRWTELGALSPLMRTHHGTDPNLEWSFEKDAETTAHYARYAQLHIRLEPVLEALGREAAATGAPMMRPLAWLDPAAPNAWTAFDEYLLGSQLLVAPVQVEGATSRAVSFPSGRWLPLLGGAPVDGNATLSVDAPVGEIPAFAQAGTVLPLLPARVQTLLPADPPLVTLSDVAQERELWLYLGASGQAVEGDGTSYQLDAAAQGTPTGFTSGGQALPACTGDADPGPCALLDADHRKATVRAFTSPLRVDGASGPLATLTVQGTRTHLDATVYW